MSDARDSKSSVWGRRIREISGELGRMIRLRRELAELELRHDYRKIRRLSVVGGIGMGFVVIGLSLLFSAAAQKLASVTEVGALAWLTGFGCALVLPGTCMIVLGVRKFRADIRLFQNTLAELREDATWLREWIQQVDSEK